MIGLAWVRHILSDLCVEKISPDSMDWVKKGLVPQGEMDCHLKEETGVYGGWTPCAVSSSSSVGFWLCHHNFSSPCQPILTLHNFARTKDFCCGPIWVWVQALPFWCSWYSSEWAAPEMREGRGEHGVLKVGASAGSSMESLKIISIWGRWHLETNVFVEVIQQETNDVLLIFWSLILIGRKHQ